MRIHLEASSVSVSQPLMCGNRFLPFPASVIKSAYLIDSVRLFHMKQLISHRPRAKQAGFTLLEVLVVIVIIGILASIAAPTWLRYLANRRAQAVQAEILQLMRQAQNTAQNTRQNQFVRIGVPAVTGQITGDENNVPIMQVGASTGVNVAALLPDLTTVTLGNDQLRPGMVTLDAFDPLGATQTFRFDFKGIARDPFAESLHPFHIEIRSNRDISRRVYCVSSISAISNLVSGSGDECAQFRQIVDDFG